MATKNDMVLQNIRSCRNTYKDPTCVSSGRYATVYRSIDSCGAPVALKVLPKNRQDISNQVNFRLISNELRTLKKLKGCKNIVQLYDTFQDDDNVYFVEEYCKNGGLDRLIKNRNKPFTELDAARLLKRILIGVNECHTNNIYHGDIKPLNIMFSRFAELRLIDFGHSEETYSVAEGCYEKRGTPWYAAPEIFFGVYGLNADIWAVGVIAYELLYNCHPFYRDDEKVMSYDQMYNRLTTGSVKTQNAALSKQTIDFVKLCLTVDPLMRLSSKDALSHGFIASV